MLWIGNDENMFVLYSYPRLDGKLNASIFDLRGPSFVFSILYKSACMDIKLSDKSQHLDHGTILLKALGGGFHVLWTHISNYFLSYLPFDAFDAISCPLCNLNNPLEYNHDTS